MHSSSALGICTSAAQYSVHALYSHTRWRWFRPVATLSSLMSLCRWTHSASSTAHHHGNTAASQAWRWQEGTALDAAARSAAVGAAAPVFERWQSRVASFLVAAGLALALFLGSSPAAFASVFPLVETPASPATLEMKVCVLWPIPLCASVQDHQATCRHVLRCSVHACLP